MGLWYTVWTVLGNFESIQNTDDPWRYRILIPSWIFFHFKFFVKSSLIQAAFGTITSGDTTTGWGDLTGDFRLISPLVAWTRIGFDFIWCFFLPERVLRFLLFLCLSWVTSWSRTSTLNKNFNNEKLVKSQILLFFYMCYPTVTGSLFCLCHIICLSHYSLNCCHQATLK